ncbi:MAG TPA: hypothetical protein V6D35_20195 [Candidatus Sericytochromatia bacterium]
MLLLILRVYYPNSERITRIFKKGGTNISNLTGQEWVAKSSQSLRA